MKRLSWLHWRDGLAIDHGRGLRRESALSQLALLAQTLDRALVVLDVNARLTLELTDAVFHESMVKILAILPLMLPLVLLQHSTLQIGMEKTYLIW